MSDTRPWISRGPRHPDGITELRIRSNSEPNLDRHVIVWWSTNNQLLTACDCPAGEYGHLCRHRGIALLLAETFI
jgi:hypothetical protein